MPVTFVTWLGAAQFTNALSAREGLAACYKIDGEQVTEVRSCDGYRLPTDVEWEYTARAGSTGRYPFKDNPKTTRKHAWFKDNSGEKPHKVGTRRANPWGLYDMHGNVWEWVWDWSEFHARSDTAVVDPRGPSEGRGRVIRGGSFYNYRHHIRSANRGSQPPNLGDDMVGFRCVRNQPSQMTWADSRMCPRM